MTWSACPSRTARRLLAGAAALTCCATLAASPVAQAAPGGGAPAGAAAAGLDPASFKGVNWADPRDNDVDGPVVPTGLSTSDDYRTTYRTSTAILSELVRIGRIDTVRLLARAARRRQLQPHDPRPGRPTDLLVAQQHQRPEAAPVGLGPRLAQPPPGALTAGPPVPLRPSRAGAPPRPAGNGSPRR